MISNRLLFIWIFLVIFIVNSDAVRRGGSSKSRAGYHSYSAGTVSNEAPQDLGRAILGILLMILSCGGGIGWKIYRCYRKEKRRKLLSTPVPYPNNIFKNSISTPIDDHQSNENKFTLISLPIESLENTSKPLQITSKEDKCLT